MVLLFIKFQTNNFDHDQDYDDDDDYDFDQL